MSDPKYQTAQILRAAVFAAEKHQSQRRKGQDAAPYINHPLAVAETLARHGFTDPVVMQAALLHDTIEDTETSEAELEREFGGEVARLVMEVTDDKLLPKAERKRMPIERAPSLSDAAKLVKLGSSPELCVKVRGSSSMLRLGCLGDLLRFEKREIEVAAFAPDRSSPQSNRGDEAERTGSVGEGAGAPDPTLDLGVQALEAVRGA